jgi:hypothetical protein
MKKILGLIAAAAVLGLHAPANAESVFGAIFQETIQPAGVASEVVPAKSGAATCKSYFGIVALGQCGVKDAMKNGGISGLSFYDVETLNILGFKKVTTKAYGR